MKKIIETFKRKNINVYAVLNKKEALNKALELIPENSSIGFGGSVTLEQIGILDVLRKRNDINLLDKMKAKNQKNLEKLYRKIFSCDIFLSSSNAITKQGQIVNVDGKGNRVAAISFGPEKVIIIAGKNKITPNLDSAIKRIKKVALPLNFKRIIKISKSSSSIFSPQKWIKENMWGQVSIIERQNNKDRIHLIIVNENLGY